LRVSPSPATAEETTPDGCSSLGGGRRGKPRLYGSSNALPQKDNGHANKFHSHAHRSQI